MIKFRSDRLRTARKRRGLNQSQFAALIGVTRAAVNYWESGRREPNMHSICKVSSALKVPVTFFYGRPKL